MSKAKTTKSKKSTTKGATKKATPAKDADLVPLSEAMKPAAREAKVSKKAKGAAKATKDSKPRKLSALDAATLVLKDAGAPMNCKGMIEAMAEKKLWTSNAPTPAATLYSAILREITKKKAESRFKKVERGQFALKD